MDPNKFTDKFSRREFIQQAGLGAAALLAASELVSCSSDSPLAHIKGEIKGANHTLGHLLRNPDTLPPPTQIDETNVLIIGGGIAGLSARRWLHRNGVKDVLLLEMDNQPGGNSASGKNDLSAYPWGAHYLPIPDLRNRELIDFLTECKAITSFDTQGLPIYNDYFLCHDPEERLFINGYWQEGLVPELGVPEEDRQQITRFFDLMNAHRKARGKDGKDAFAIPLRESSQDETYRQLDQLSFDRYLSTNGFTSSYLRWYLSYACRDDYGSDLAQTSAWAGIHYFAARKGQAANADASAVLTWPEGNGFLVDQLRRQARAPIQNNRLVFAVKPEASTVLVSLYDPQKKQTLGIRAKKVILATPQFVNRQLLKNVAGYSPPNNFQYAPWVVANLTVNGLPQGKGMPLCWDNVLYGSSSVGYITANHQHLTQERQKVITFYQPLTDEAPNLARQRAYRTSYADWLSRIVAELEMAHPGVTPLISQADLWIWGHGMIAPTPGFLTDPGRQQLNKSIDNQVFFAHSDLSGISIFEEAFYQGIRAAEEILRN
ncbi:FAD-dependent oxidoreductase [Tellurirhabdus bombi]|uniref:FAD-dependent oxidoreductase n=1 Tax=Tellurirhabdus bombi TaxID=2907205 RepID=UPI001F2E9B2B|nr:NAD(P)/FAD-dependent oxidoreductase [Tellurirhabdus bombi]